MTCFEIKADSDTHKKAVMFFVLFFILNTRHLGSDFYACSFHILEGNSPQSLNIFNSLSDMTL